MATALPSSTHGPPSLRFSESALPERWDPEFYVAADGAGTRNSLVALDHAPGRMPPLGLKHGLDTYRDSCTSVASGFDPLQFWDVDAEVSHGSLSMTGRSNDPYHGVTVDVNSHSINNQGVVMYHVDIKGPDGILSTYTIRRRYRAFKNLHAELHRLMDEYAAANSAAAAAAAAAKERSTKELVGSELEPFIPLSPISMAQENQQKQQQQQRQGPPLSAASSRALKLPSLPSAGVWSYLKRHDVHLVEQRKRRFQEILRLAIRHPATKHSAKLEAFLSVAPSEISQRGSSYVSLQDYSVPVYDRQRESIERRQRKMRVLEDRRMRTASAEAPAHPQV